MFHCMKFFTLPSHHLQDDTTTGYEESQTSTGREESQRSTIDIDTETNQATISICKTVNNGCRIFLMGASLLCLSLIFSVFAVVFVIGLKIKLYRLRKRLRGSGTTQNMSLQQKNGKVIVRYLVFLF